MLLAVSRNGVAFAQNKVNAFFVCPFPNKENILIRRSPYSYEIKGARGGKI